MEVREEPSILKPIILIITAGLIGIGLSILSLGVLAPLGVLLFLISVFLFGFWILINKSAKHWKAIVGVLIACPVILIISFLVRALL